MAEKSSLEDNERVCKIIYKAVYADTKNFNIYNNFCQDDMKLNEIWHACRKIQNTIFRYGYDICAEFCPYDPRGTGLISRKLATNCKISKIIFLNFTFMQKQYLATFWANTRA